MMVRRAVRMGSCGALAVAASFAACFGGGCGAPSHRAGKADASSPDDASSAGSSDGSRRDGGGPDARADAAAVGLDGALATDATDSTLPVADASDATAPAEDAPEGSEAADGGSSVVITDASCPVEIDHLPLLPATHVAIGSSIQWNSNPPSSGPHYPIWAAYQAYATPVPRGYYVHDLEHGAIVFLYNCGDAGCPDVVAALQSASDAIPDDPLCTSLGEGVRVRTVITPDPLIDVPVAAAAWGWVYKAQCADLPTLRDFAMQHYGQGPEMLCNNGQAQF